MSHELWIIGAKKFHDDRERSKSDACQTNYSSIIHCDYSWLFLVDHVIIWICKNQSRLWKDHLIWWTVTFSTIGWEIKGAADNEKNENKPTTFCFNSWCTLDDVIKVTSSGVKMKKLQTNLTFTLYVSQISFSLKSTFLRVKMFQPITARHKVL